MSARKARPLRVLLAIHRPQRRGAEVFARQLADALAERGHETRLIALYAPAPGSSLRMDAFDRCLGGKPGHPMERLPGLHPVLLFRLRREIRHFDPDIVQANGSRTVKYGAAAAATLPGRHWALVYRNIGDPSAWQTSAWRQTIYRRLVMPWMDGVASGSESNLERVMAMYRLRVPAAVIPRGIDPDRLAPRKDRRAVRRAEGVSNELPVLIYVGSLTFEKRVDRLLEVMAGLRAEGIGALLWVVGDGPLRDALERNVHDMGLTKQVRFFGVRERIGDLLAAADLLALASDTEGTPGVVLEAAALGVPVVATRVGGIEDCALDGETALLVEPTDIPAFTAAVAGLFADPRRRRTMGEQGRRWIAERFLLADVAARYESFYHRVLAACGSRAKDLL